MLRITSMVNMGTVRLFTNAKNLKFRMKEDNYVKDTALCNFRYSLYSGGGPNKIRSRLTKYSPPVSVNTTVTFL